MKILWIWILYIGYSRKGPCHIFPWIHSNGMPIGFLWHFPPQARTHLESSRQIYIDIWNWMSPRNLSRPGDSYPLMSLNLKKLVKGLSSKPLQSTIKQYRYNTGSLNTAYSMFSDTGVHYPWSPCALPINHGQNNVFHVFGCLFYYP